MDIKNIALIGAGAVGAYFIYGLTNCADVSFCVAAEGERAEKLKRDGIIINDQTYHPVVKTPQEAKGADLLLICTKYHGLKSTLDMIETITDEHTIVMSLLNGIDSEEIIGERIGMEHMIYSVMRISSERRNGKITFPADNTYGVTMGEKGTSEKTERLQAVYDVMTRAGLNFHFHPDILMDQWSKYSMNIIYNLPQAILGTGFKSYYDSEHMGAIRDRLFDEVRMVANAEGIPLKEQQDWRPLCKDTARFSTLQDIDAGRHTEIDMLAGVLIRLAKKHGIAVPFAEYTYMAIKVLEEKNDGKFNY